MPAVQRRRPIARAMLSTGTLVQGDPVISRLLSEQADATQAQQGRERSRVIIPASLIVGVNRINHGLAYPARVALVTPSVADPTFAYCLTSSDERTAVITVVGVAQPNCTVEMA